MEKEIKTTKPVAKKRKAPKPKSTVEMISYSIKMVIPTVAYGNIQPEIVVKASSPQEAHDFIVPHMNKLWKEYYLVDGKRPVEPVKVQKAPEIKTYPDIKPLPLSAKSPISSVALVKATQAINSCMSMEAYDLIVKQVRVSVKLTDEDKESLQPILKAKYLELKK